MNDFRRKFWIRKDREQYFLFGVIAACVMGGFVTTWWHFLDKVAVERRIVMRKTPKITRSKEAELLKEDHLAPGGSKLLEIGRALEDDDASAAAQRSGKGMVLTPAVKKQKSK
jgi:hypothetical protein